MVRRYAQDTSVSYYKSREKIAALLENWGATGVQWTDEWGETPQFTCRFLWKFKDEDGSEHPLMAKFVLKCNDEILLSRSVDGRSGQVSENKYEKEKKQWVNRTHRLLLLLLTAMFNAIDEGLYSPEELFATFVEHQSGMTIGELLTKNFALLPMLDSSKLLTGPKV